MTRQQEVILSVVRQSSEHLTADKIFFLAKDRLPKIAVGTVYRNLNQLVDSGVIKRVRAHGTADRFDKNTFEHDHMICEKCGKVKDVFLAGVEELIREQTNEDIISVDMSLRYICEECRKQIAEERMQQ